jgi:hypothetical protein
MSDKELEPCPFCGGELDDTISTFKWCKGCYAEVYLDDEMWNTRHITLSQAKRVLAEAGLVAVPIEPDDRLNKHVLKLWTTSWHHPSEVYRSLIKAAQEPSK